MGNGLTEQTENISKLLKLIQENPDLPIVPMVDADIVADDSGYWSGKWGHAEIDKYIVHDERIIFYEGKDPDIVGIFERFFDYAECGIDEEMPDSEALPIMKEKIDSLNWTEAIIVYINMPDEAL